jgi:erythromycin esterase-like protein
LELGPGDVGLVLAHNGHVAREDGMVHPTMGARLADALGDDYVPIGTILHDGRALSRLILGPAGHGHLDCETKMLDQSERLLEIWLKAPSPDSLESVLGNSPHAIAALRWAGVTLDEPVRSWLGRTQLMRQIGSPTNCSLATRLFAAMPSRTFDGVFVLRGSRAAEAIK